MLIDAAAVTLDMNARIGAPHMAQFRASEPREAGPRVTRLAGDKDDLVITPGGPRPRGQVHHVRPGEVVRRNDDGTYTVVPAAPPTTPKSTDDGDKDK